jgi:hypothetical protein
MIEFLEIIDALARGVLCVAIIMAIICIIIGLGFVVLAGLRILGGG